MLVFDMKLMRASYQMGFMSAMDRGLICLPRQILIIMEDMEQKLLLGAQFIETVQVQVEMLQAATTHHHPAIQMMYLFIDFIKRQ
jgi:hypothetical protein